MKSETYNMDCMEYMHGLHDKSFELAIVDVPYGIKQGGEKNYTRGKLAIAKNYHAFSAIHVLFVAISFFC